MTSITELPIDVLVHRIALPRLSLTGMQFLFSCCKPLWTVAINADVKPVLALAKTRYIHSLRTTLQAAEKNTLESLSLRLMDVCRSASCVTEAEAQFSWVHGKRISLGMFVDKLFVAGAMLDNPALMGDAAGLIDSASAVQPRNRNPMMIPLEFAALMFACEVDSADAVRYLVDNGHYALLCDLDVFVQLDRARLRGSIRVGNMLRRRIMDGKWGPLSADAVLRLRKDACKAGDVFCARQCFAFTTFPVVEPMLPVMDVVPGAVWIQDACSDTADLLCLGDKAMLEEAAGVAWIRDYCAQPPASANLAYDLVRAVVTEGVSPDISLSWLERIARVTSANVPTQEFAAHVAKVHRFWQLTGNDHPVDRRTGLNSRDCRVLEWIRQRLPAGEYVPLLGAKRWAVVVRDTIQILDDGRGSDGLAAFFSVMLKDLEGVFAAHENEDKPQPQRLLSDLLDRRVAGRAALQFAMSTIVAEKRAEVAEELLLFINDRCVPLRLKRSRMVTLWCWPSLPPLVEFILEHLPLPSACNTALLLSFLGRIPAPVAEQTVRLMRHRIDTAVVEAAIAAKTPDHVIRALYTHVPIAWQDSTWCALRRRKARAALVKELATVREPPASGTKRRKIA